MAFTEDIRPTSSWTLDTAQAAVYSLNPRGPSAMFFDTWDDSFDLIETCFDDDNEVPGQEFTEDTHP